MADKDAEEAEKRARESESTTEPGDSTSGASSGDSERAGDGSGASTSDSHSDKTGGEEEGGESAADKFRNWFDSKRTKTPDAPTPPGTPKKSSSGEFLLDALYGVFGMERGKADPSGSATADDYPWVEFVDRSVNLGKGKHKEGEKAGGEKFRVAYRNKDTGEVTTVKPPDFDKYGSAQELDTETVALTLVQPREKTRWEAYSDLLRDSPLMRALYEAGEAVAASPVGDAVEDVRERASHARERAKQEWETSQNPLIYAASSTVDSLFGETEQAKAMGRIQQLDPDFDMGPEFIDEMRSRLIPDVVSAFLRGDRLVLSAWCTDGALERINSVFRARETEGLVADHTILGINNVTVMGARAPAKEDPVILLSALVQQIHCLRKEGKVVEGSEDEIRAVVYVFALQRQYNPEKGGLVWQVSEMTYSGGMLYL